MSKIEELHKKAVPEKVRAVIKNLNPLRAIESPASSESRRNFLQKLSYGAIGLFPLPGATVKAVTNVIESVLEKQEGVKKQTIRTEFTKIEVMAKRINLGNFFEEVERTLKLRQDYLDSYMRSPFGKKAEFNKQELSRTEEWLEQAFDTQKIGEELEKLIKELEVLENMIRNSEDLNWKFVPHKNSNPSLNEMSRLNLVKKKKEQAERWKIRVQEIEGILSEWTDVSFEKYKEAFSQWEEQEEQMIQAYEDALEKGVYVDNEAGKKDQEERIKAREILYEKLEKRKKPTREKREERASNIAIMKAKIVGYNNLSKKEQKLRKVQQKIDILEINISERRDFIKFRQGILNQLEKTKNNIPMNEFTKACNKIEKYLGTF